MKKNILIIMLITAGMQLAAQTSWITTTGTSNPVNQPQDFAIKPDGNILFINNSIGYSDDLRINEIYELSPDGEILNLLAFESTNKQEVFNQIAIINDTVYIAGNALKTDVNNIPFIIFKSFSLLLEEIVDVEITLNDLQGNEGFYPGKQKYIDGNFVYLLSSYSPANYSPMYVEISKEGELIDFVVDNDETAFIMAYDFVKLTDNSGFQVFDMGRRIHYNNDFTEKEVELLPNNFTSFFTHFPISDTTFYLGGQWINPNYSNGWRAGILKMTTGNMVVVEFLYEAVPDTSGCPAYRNSVDQTPDGNIIFGMTGNIVLQLYPQNKPAYINLFKLTPDLDIIWHRYIGFDDSKNDAFVVRANDEGEIIIFAALSPAPSTNYDSQLMFIKTDQDGIITSVDNRSTKFTSTETLLYPNPAQGQIVVEFSLAYSRAWLEVSNMDGQQVFATPLTENAQQVDISALPAGSYIYRIYNNAGLNQSGKLIVNK